MNDDLSPRDRELLAALVDEQLSPMRKAAWGLIGLSVAALAVAALEWNDARARLSQSLLPSTSWIALAAFAVLAAAGFALYRSNRDPTSHPTFRALTDGRHEVSRLEVIRVVNSRFDRIVVHTPRSREPIRFIVESHDREAIAALLARVCRNLRG